MTRIHVIISSMNEVMLLYSSCVSEPKLACMGSAAFTILVTQPSDEYVKYHRKAKKASIKKKATTANTDALLLEYNFFIFSFSFFEGEFSFSSFVVCLMQLLGIVQVKELDAPLVSILQKVQTV